MNGELTFDFFNTAVLQLKVVSKLRFVFRLLMIFFVKTMNSVLFVLLMAVPINIFLQLDFSHLPFSKLLTKANISGVSNSLVLFGMTIFVSVRLKSFQNIFN